MTQPDAINDLNVIEVNNFPNITRHLLPLTDKELKYHSWYMDSAIRASVMSHCVRRIVGAVVVKDGHVISTGWNGQPEGFTNICELPDGSTDPLVRHAERNALDRFIGRSESVIGSTMYVTTGPCLDCAITIKTRAKLTKVYFKEFYRTSAGIEYLINQGVEVYQFDGKEMYKCSTVTN